MQAIRTRYHGPTDRKGSRFTASAEAGSVTVPYDYSLNNDKNHAKAAEALAMKLNWVKTPAEFRNTYVAGVFGGDYYFVDKKGGSLRHTHRIEFEIQGNYGSLGWECVATADTMKEARQTLRDYNDNEKQYPHRIKRVRVQL